MAPQMCVRIAWSMSSSQGQVPLFQLQQALLLQLRGRVTSEGDGLFAHLDVLLLQLLVPEALPQPSLDGHEHLPLCQTRRLSWPRISRSDKVTWHRSWIDPEQLDLDGGGGGGGRGFTIQVHCHAGLRWDGHWRGRGKKQGPWEQNAIHDVPGP